MVIELKRNFGCGVRGGDHGAVFLGETTVGAEFVGVNKGNQCFRREFPIVLHNRFFVLKTIAVHKGTRGRVAFEARIGSSPGRIRGLLHEGNGFPKGIAYGLRQRVGGGCAGEGGNGAYA